jgi:hypothetical protein
MLFRFLLGSSPVERHYSTVSAMRTSGHSDHWWCLGVDVIFRQQPLGSSCLDPNTRRQRFYCLQSGRVNRRFL